MESVGEAMKPYACHNSPRHQGYYAKAGSVVMDDKNQEEGLVLDQLVMWVDDTLSKECRYDQRANDPRCQGCGK